MLLFGKVEPLGGGALQVKVCSKGRVPLALYLGITFHLLSLFPRLLMQSDQLPQDRTLPTKGTNT